VSPGEVNLTKAQELVTWLLESGDYLDARVLPDGSVAALIRLMFTKAICLGCTYYGFESRFCFEDFDLAHQRFAELQSQDDEPAGHIARR
jgi:hypothetical protein